MPSRRALTVVIFLLLTFHLQANGYRNPPDGARALALAGGKIANLDDPSVISHNPANLTLFDHKAFQAAYTLAFSEIEYEGIDGSSEHTKSPWKLLPPSLYYVHPIKPEELVFGLGLNSPAGQFTVWDRDGSIAKSAPYFAKLAIFNVKPTLGVKINEQLSVGFGADFYFSKLWVDQLVPPGFAAIDTKTEAEGFGVGGNFGLTYRFNERHRLAFTYKSEVDVEYDGEYKVYVPPMRLNGNFDTNIRFPAIATIGYGYSMTENLTIGIDVEWLEFSDYDDLSLDNGNDLGPPRRWHRWPPPRLERHMDGRHNRRVESQRKLDLARRLCLPRVAHPRRDLLPHRPLRVRPSRPQLWRQLPMGRRQTRARLCLPHELPQRPQHSPLYDNGSPNPYGGHYEPEMHLFSIGYTRDF